MQLNQIGSPLDRAERNKLNQNWTTIEKEFINVVDTVSEQAYNQVVDAAKIEWLSPVNTLADIETTYPDATQGKTVMVRDTGKVYRKNEATEWIEIQDIDPTVINEVDNRLTAQLAEKANTDDVVSLLEYQQIESKVLLSEKQLLGVTVSKELEKGIVTFIYDDGLKDHYNNVYPLHLSKGIPFTAAIDVNNVLGKTDKMSYLQLKEMYESGLLEVASHGMTHDPLDSSMTVENTKYELEESKRVLNRLGFDVKTFVAPSSTFDKANAEKYQVLKDLYDVGFINYVDSRVEPIENLINPNPYELKNLHRASVAEQSLATLQSWIDYAEVNKEWLVIYAHGVSDTGEITTANLGSLLDYTTSKNVDILNPKDAVSYLSTAHVAKENPQRMNNNIIEGLTKGYNNLLINPIFNGGTIPDYWDEVEKTGTVTPSILKGLPGNVYMASITSGSQTIRQDIPSQYFSSLQPMSFSSIVWSTAGGKVGLRIVCLDNANAEVTSTEIYKEFNTLLYPKAIDVSTIALAGGNNSKVRVEIKLINSSTTASSIRVQLPQLSMSSKRGEFNYDNSREPNQAFHAQKSTDQTVGHGAYAKVNFTFVSKEDVTDFQNSTFIAKATGRYNFSAAVGFATSVDQKRLILAIYRNGTLYASTIAQSSGTETQGLTLSCVAQANKGDTFELYVRQDTGDNVVLSQTPYTHFSGHLIK